jgi:hypothetical protein
MSATRKTCSILRKEQFEHSRQHFLPVASRMLAAAARPGATVHEAKNVGLTPNKAASYAMGRRT